MFERVYREKKPSIIIKNIKKYIISEIPISKTIDLIREEIYKYKDEIIENCGEISMIELDFIFSNTDEIETIDDFNNNFLNNLYEWAESNNILLA